MFFLVRVDVVTNLLALGCLRFHIVYDFHSAFRSDMFTGYTEYDDAAKAASAGTEAFYVPAECDDYTGGIIRSLLEDYAARGVMSEEACRALAEELNTVLSAE